MPVDYDILADVYANSRSADQLVVDELLTHSGITAQSCVLEVGCGTADYLSAVVNATGCNGWGVEPSAGMRAHAPQTERLQLTAGRAEEIPLAADQFDFVFTVNVVHHMADPAAWFHEAYRVLKPGSIVCTVTESHAMIGRRMPLAKYWPAIVEPECARYPTIERLQAEMQSAGFKRVKVREISRRYDVTDAIPFEQQAFSSLLLISPSEFQVGLLQLQADLQREPIAGLSEYACVWGDAG